MERAKVKSVYHGVQVNAYDPKDAFQKAIEKIKNSKALYQGGVFRDEPESVKRVVAGSKPKVMFEKMPDVKVEKLYDVAGTLIGSLRDAKTQATKVVLETKQSVEIKLAPASVLAYKVKFEAGMEGEYAVNLVEDGVPLND